MVRGGRASERPAVDEGWYEGNVLGLLGDWDAQLFRARRGRAWHATC